MTTTEITRPTDLSALPPRSLELNSRLLTSRTALVIPEDLSWEETRLIEDRMEFTESGFYWWRGDFYNYVQRRFPDQYKQFVDESLTANQTIANNQAVSERYNLTERRADLSYSHHQLAAYLEPPIRRRLLELAAENKWSCARLRQEIAAMQKRVEEVTSGEGEQSNSDYLPLDLPITPGQLYAVAEDHLEEDDIHALYTMLGTLLGVEE